MVSVYFKDKEQWQLVKRAAKAMKIKASEFMRDTILTKAEQVCARKRPKKAA